MTIFLRNCGTLQVNVKKVRGRFHVSWFVHVHNGYKIIPGKLSPAFPSAIAVVGTYVIVSVLAYICHWGILLFDSTVSVSVSVYRFVITLGSTSRSILKLEYACNSYNGYNLHHEVMAWICLPHYRSCWDCPHKVTRMPRTDVFAICLKSRRVNWLVVLLWRFLHFCHISLRR